MRVNVGIRPNGVAVTPDGKKVYITNISSDDVTVVNVWDDSIITTIPVGDGPTDVCITPDGKKAYVTNYNAGTVSVICIKKEYGHDYDYDRKANKRLCYWSFLFSFLRSHGDRSIGSLKEERSMLCLCHLRIKIRHLGMIIVISRMNLLYISFQMY